MAIPPFPSKPLPRLRIVPTMAGVKLAAGDTLRIVVPDLFTVVNPGATINRNDGNGAVLLFNGLGPYVLQAADIPAIGGSFPVIPMGTLQLAIGPTFGINNPALAPSAPTIGLLTMSDDGTTISVTGTPGSNGGATVTGWELKTYRFGTNELIDTKQGTSLPVTSNTLPRNVKVYGKLAAINSAGTGQQSDASNPLTTMRLLGAAVNNRPLGTSIVTIAASGSHVSRTAICVYEPFTVGSGDLTSFQLSFGNITMLLEASDTMTVTSLRIHNDAGTINLPIDVPGGYPFSVTNNQNDAKRTIEKLVDGLGALTLAQGSQVYIRLDGTVPLNAKVPLIGDRMPSNANAKSLFTIYDPAVTTLTDPATSNGRPAVASGAALPTTSSLGWGATMLGRYTSEDVVVPFLAGDSNMYGFIDLAINKLGKGTGQYALRGNDSASQLLSGINCSLTGIDMVQMFNNPAIAYWFRFCTMMVLQPLGNDIPNNGSITLATLRTREDQLRNQMIASNPTGRRVRMKIGPHTDPAPGYTSANAWTLPDQSDQVLMAGYESGGVVDQFAAYIQSLVGQSGGYAAYVDTWIDLVGPDTRKFKGTGTYGELTTDGKHVVTAGEQSKGARLRAQLFN